MKFSKASVNGNEERTKYKNLADRTGINRCTINFLQDFLDFLFASITVYVHFKNTFLHAQAIPKSKTGKEKISL